MMSETIDIQPAANQWYVVHCKYFNEARAATALAELLGVETYLPEVRRRFRGKLQRAPFFPGYLFVRTDLGKVALSRINATPGVLRLVSFDHQPQPLPAAVVDWIRERLDRLNAHGGIAPHDFQPGDIVRLKRGPLQGLEALFVGPMKPTDRVRVLIDFMGQQREAELDVDLLERTTPAAHTARSRGTRGGGRTIRQHQT
jgi:transcriptional antiterminator RfaH